MIIQKTLTIPFNTTKTELLIEDIKLTKGIIYQLDVYFPPGSCGLMGICITLNESQLYPNEIGEFFIGDNNIISFPDTTVIKDSPYILQLKGYNEDTIYNHSVIVRIGFESNNDLISRYIPKPIDEIIEKINESTNKLLQSNYIELKNKASMRISK